MGRRPYFFAQKGVYTHEQCVALGFSQPRLRINVISLFQRVHAGEGDHSELRSPLSPVLCSLVLPCSLPFAILRSSQKVALPASATGSGRACFPQRPPIPFGRRFKPKQVRHLFSRFTVIHSRPASGSMLCTSL